MRLYCYDGRRIAASSNDTNQDRRTTVDITDLIDRTLGPERRMTTLMETWDDVRARIPAAIEHRPAITLDPTAVEARPSQACPR